LPAGREVGTRKWFVNRLFEADLDAAERVGDQGETEQPDLGVVVHGDAGEVSDRFDQGLATRLGTLRRGIVEGVTGLHQAGPLLLPGCAVDAVDLRLAQSGGLDVGVARNRDRGGRLPAVRYADQDDGVGVGGFLVAGAQRRQLLGGQRVAVRVGAAVQADQQNVDRTVVAAATQRGRRHVEDPVLE